MRKRDHISLETKLAAALLAWDQRGTYPRITHERAKTMTAKQIIALVQFHHYPIEHVNDGPDEPWNLEPMFKLPHLAETKKQATERAHERKVCRSKTLHDLAMTDKGWLSIDTMPGNRTVLVKTVMGKVRRARAKRGYGIKAADRYGPKRRACWRADVSGDLTAIAWRPE